MRSKSIVKASLSETTEKNCPDSSVDKTAVIAQLVERPLSKWEVVG